MVPLPSLAKPVRGFECTMKIYEEPVGGTVTDMKLTGDQRRYFDNKRDMRVKGSERSRTEQNGSGATSDAKGG